MMEHLFICSGMTCRSLQEVVSVNDLRNFDMNAGIKQLLLDKNITSLFDIQSACYPHAIAGKDIVGRARTGCGKTLAFVLPIVEILIRENIKPVPGGPNVICLLPTRELAKQVRQVQEHCKQKRFSLCALRFCTSREHTRTQLIYFCAISILSISAFSVCMPFLSTACSYPSSAWCCLRGGVV